MTAIKDKGDESNSAEPSIVNMSLDTKMVEHSFSAIKKKWLMTAPEEESCPAYRDEAATIYLQFTTKFFWKYGLLRKIILQHPLSYKRDLCFIAKHMDKPAQSGKIIAVLKKIGIEGKIKMIPISLVKLAIANEDFEALDELATLYDTHLSEQQLNLNSLVFALKKQSKRIIRADLQPGELDAGFHLALATVPVLPATEGNRFTFKVGHLGMTTEQVVANVEGALVYLQKKGFPEGLDAFESVQLKTGDQDGQVYNLYLDGERRFQPDKKQSKQPSTESEPVPKKSRVKNDVPVPAAPTDEEEKTTTQKAVHRDIPIPAEFPRGSLQLETGLTSLQQLLGWKATAVAAAAVPRFTDDDATISLRLKPTAGGLVESDRVPTVTLTHPLSFKRRVCVVVRGNPQGGVGGRRAENPAEVAMKELVKTLGVQGFTKVLMMSSSGKALHREPHDELAAAYDTHVAHYTLAKACAGLADALAAQGKALASADLDGQGARTEMEQALALSPVAVDSSGYVVKVGHTGLSRLQLAENVEAALAQVLALPLFPRSLECFQAVWLENGRGQGVPIYVNAREADDADVDNDSTVVALPRRKRKRAA